LKVNGKISIVLKMIEGWGILKNQEGGKKIISTRREGFTRQGGGGAFISSPRELRGKDLHSSQDPYLYIFGTSFLQKTNI